MEDKLWDDLFYPLVHHDTASLFTTLVRPKSRGWLRLRSSDSLDQPIIDPQYYSCHDDLKAMLEGNISIRFEANSLTNSSVF